MWSKDRTDRHVSLWELSQNVNVVRQSKQENLEVIMSSCAPPAKVMHQRT